MYQLCYNSLGPALILDFLKKNVQNFQTYISLSKFIGQRKQTKQRKKKQNFMEKT